MALAAPASRGVSPRITPVLLVGETVLLCWWLSGLSRAPSVASGGWVGGAMATCSSLAMLLSSVVAGFGWVRCFRPWCLFFFLPRAWERGGGVHAMSSLKPVDEALFLG